MVDVVDLLDPVVLLQRHGVEAAHLADAGERGLEAREAPPSWSRAQVLVVVEDDVRPLRSLHRARRSGRRRRRLQALAARSCDSSA